jgi:hypothetical protein
LAGAGAEVASSVLPAIASAFGLVANVLEKIGPILPGILAGFLGFKAVTLLAGPIDATWP